MATAYAKGTQVWYPDSTLAWVPATVTSLTLPSDEAPTSLVELTITFDENTSSADAGDSKVLKLPLSALESAEGGGGVNGVQGSTAAPGQDALPPLRNPPLLESAEDLASLSNLNEPSGESWSPWRSDLVLTAVLHAIKTRYEMHAPYTYSGIVLVSPLSTDWGLLTGRLRSILSVHCQYVSYSALA
jgi:myosin-5